ncbi:hypothetical protein BJV78DRAFT_775023 [Lactifluus subvellereus]|nr:hypothetical protein BJV78DRAFT_775023 [Lactifluus subvellereus]
MEALDVSRVRGMTGTSKGGVGDVGTKRVFELPRGLWYKRNIIGTKPVKGGKREKGFHSPPLSFTEASHSPSPQSYIANSLILLAYPIALSEELLLASTSLNRMASGDLARMRVLGSGDGDRVKVLGDLVEDLVEGVRGKDESLFRLVNRPFCAGSEGPSSGACSFVLRIV